MPFVLAQAVVGAERHGSAAVVPTNASFHPTNVWYIRSTYLSWSGSQPWTGMNTATEEEHAGVLFTNVTIPAGSTITAATITTNSLSGDGGGARNLDIYGYKAGLTPAHPATLAAAQTLDQATKTTATAQWAGPLTYPASGLVTPDISAVIQEVIGQAGWASGDSILVFINGNAANGGGANYDTELDTTVANWTLDVTYH